MIWVDFSSWTTPTPSWSLLYSTIVLYDDYFHRMDFQIFTNIFIIAGPPTGGGGGQLGHFAPGPSLKGAPGGPTKGPLNTCLKDRHTLIEQSDLNTLIEQSQYYYNNNCRTLKEYTCNIVCS